MPLLYEDIKGIARGQLRRSSPGQTLNTTALVNEAYLKLQGGNRQKFPVSESEFMALAACVMRGIIVDTVRAKVSAKRGEGAVPLELDEQMVQSPGRDEQILALDEALSELATVDEDLVQLVECKFFAGYSGDEIGQMLGRSRRSVQRDWQRAKALLSEMMQSE